MRRMPHMDRRGQRGLAMVEFTIVLPVLLLLLLGVTELGRALMRYNALTKALQDGARYAAAHALGGDTKVVNVDAQLQADVRNVVVYGNKAGTGRPVLHGLLPSQVLLVDAGGDQIRLEANYPYVPIFGSLLPDFQTGSSIATAFTMQASVSMRAL
jgi:Flp pilus assembly protein TadG